MDIELLKTFLEVRNTRHFGKAADNLYLTQAAVSARIKQLEDYLGVKLFIRIRNNIQLTAEGERLVPHAETMLLSWSRARQEVALKEEQKQQLTIGTTSGIWHYILQDKLSEIHRQMPELALRAEAYTVDELLRLLGERMLDVCIVYEAPNQPDLSTRPIGKLKLVLSSTIPDATAKSAFLDNYVYLDWGTAFEMFHARRFGDVPPAVLHTNMASIAETYISKLPGSAYLPERLLSESANKDLKAVEGAPSFARDIYLVYRTGSDRLDLIERVVPLLTI